VRLRITKIILCLLILTTCSKQGGIIEEIDTNSYLGIEISAMLSKIDDDTKIVYFEIDELLYVLTIMKIDDDKIFDIRIKDANNTLLFNGPNLFLIRTEFINGKIFNIEVSNNRGGLSAEYNLSDNNMNYRRYW